MKIKYIIIDELYPRLCSLAEQHSDVANGYKVTSAGFCSFEQGDGSKDGMGWLVSCWGESLSLKIKSDPEHDSHLIERLLSGS